MKASGEKIAALTCYDATFARAIDAAGIDLILVGDSLGMVVQGSPDTTRVSLEDIEYHTRCVSRNPHKTFVAADMPLSGIGAGGKLIDNAKRLLFAGAGMVKIEGGADMADAIAQVVEAGIPVCGHIGLQPQSAGGNGGLRKGVDEEGIRKLVDDAVALEKAGVSLMVLEMVSVEGVAAVARAAKTPAIGIGSGAGCDGQILVMHDMLGLLPAGHEKPLRFVKDFLASTGSIASAFSAYRDKVKSGEFPGKEHAFARA